MEKWKRWQDWVALAAGVVAALAPVFTDTTTRATWTMVVLGVLAIAASVYSLAKPGDVLSEGSHLVLGALLIIAPWVMGFDDMMGLAWTAWITGAVTLIMGAFALPIANRMHSGGMAPQH